MEKFNIYNVIIMDRSGSMSSIASSAISGFNELLESVKKTQAESSDTQNNLMSLVLFDSTSVDTLHWNSNPNKVEPLSHKTYVPGACTPLYDAMGITLSRLEKEIGDNKRDGVAVTIITDGYENSSHEFNLKTIASMVERLKEKGWTFAYMGTDHDVTAVTHTLKIDNAIMFDKSDEGTGAVFEAEREARRRWNAEYAACMYDECTMKEEELLERKRRLAKEYFKKR